ncbi:unnamed protein product [Phaeothamnion confervicola]
MSSPWMTGVSRRAQSNYLRQAGRVIGSCGLSIARFNQLSKDVAQDRNLRNRVTQQAYLYRVAAELNSDKIPSFEDVRETRPPRRRRRGGGPLGPQGAVVMEPPATAAQLPTRAALFAKSVREIEELRLDHRKRLMESLECDDLPMGLCKPAMGKIASPTVRRACEYFTHVAENIVQSNGLRPDEFNRMLGRSRRNVLFRTAVLYHLRQLDGRP